MKGKESMRTTAMSLKSTKTSDKIKVAIRIRPPLFKEIHEEKAFYEIEDVSLFKILITVV